MNPEEFNDLLSRRILERKQRAEEKRHKDLRIIAERNSNLGIHPVEDLFPEKIWIKILHDRDLGPRDRYNICQVHPAFSDILKGTRIQDVLLPLLLDYKMPFMTKYLVCIDGMDHGWAIPQVRSGTLRNLIALRAVSKGIRGAVDKWVEDDLLDSMRSMCYKPRFKSKMFCLGDANEKNIIEKVRRGSFSIKSGRMFLRSLTLHFRVPTDAVSADIFLTQFAKFKDRILELLEAIGDQILYLNLSFEQAEMPTKPKELVWYKPKPEPLPLVVHSNIRDLLQLMPNLKWLDLCTGNYGIDSEDQYSMTKLSALERVDMKLAEHQQELDSIADDVLAKKFDVKYAKVSLSGWPGLYCHAY